MAKPYVTKEEFSELVDRFNSLVEELQASNLTKPSEFDELSYDYDTEETDSDSESEEESPQESEKFSGSSGEPEEGEYSSL